MYLKIFKSLPERKDDTFWLIRLEEFQLRIHNTDESSMAVTPWTWLNAGG